MLTWIRRLPLLCLVGLALFLSAQALRSDSRPAPEGAAILTIAGDIARTNRGPFDPKLDGIFKYHEINFDSAFALDRAMLEKLPQVEFEAQLPEGHERARFSGPRLSAALELAGAPKVASLKTTALDGYVTEISPQELEGGDWILVLRRNGKSFDIGGFGPVMLMRQPKTVEIAEDASWPWAVFYIEVVGE